MGDDEWCRECYCRVVRGVRRVCLTLWCRRDLNDVVADQMTYIDEQNSALGEVRAGSE